MSYEEAVKAWAAKKLDIDPALIDRVVFETTSGWGGTDVTAGDDPTFSMEAKLVDGDSREVMEFDEAPWEPGASLYRKKEWNLAELLAEILAAVDKKAN